MDRKKYPDSKKGKRRGALTGRSERVYAGPDRLDGIELPDDDFGHGQNVAPNETDIEEVYAGPEEMGRITRDASEAESAEAPDAAENAAELPDDETPADADTAPAADALKPPKEDAQSRPAEVDPAVVSGVYAGPQFMMAYAGPQFMTAYAGPQFMMAYAGPVPNNGGGFFLSDFQKYGQGAPQNTPAATDNTAGAAPRKFCRECGSLLEENWKFCINCGTKLT